MSKTLCLAALSALFTLGLAGCHHDHDHDMDHDNAKMMSDDACPHCPGKQTATADGRCPICGAKVSTMKKSSSGSM